MKIENWTSKLGVILAVSGSAIGLGNFLRFPQQAAQNGGGAFMIPYFIALILLGIPLMWVEWTLGRMGGISGAHTLPEIYQSVFKKRFVKFLGVFGLFMPFIVFVYYTYIESWSLGYAFFSISGKYWGLGNEKIGEFFANYVGISNGSYFNTMFPAVFFFIITLVVNLYVLMGGISKGIERLCNIAMPILLVLAFILMGRVLTLPGIDKGFGFLWNPDFSKLKDPKVWLAAAGQIFFTLSLGFGVIQTYASYLKKNDDVALSGLTSSFVNEFAEVILGASIAIPAAVVFFGITGTQEIAQKGVVSLGFNTLPIIFQKLIGGRFFGFIWFVLLFFAGITSSISLGQPLVAFLKKQLGLSQKGAVMVLGTVTLLYSIPVIYYFNKGFMDEMDFWAGGFFIVVSALIELLLFGWVLGIDKGFEELNRDGLIRVPAIFKFVIKYISPVYIMAILISWIYSKLPAVLRNTDPYIMASRMVMILFLLIFLYFIHKKIRG